LFLASAPPVGAMIGALLAGIVLQKFGRKMTLMVSVVIAFIAFLVLATSSIHENTAVMIVARVFQGMSVGFSMASATIYVSFMFH
jgi:MFS family permease